MSQKAAIYGVTNRLQLMPSLAEAREAEPILQKALAHSRHYQELSKQARQKPAIEQGYALVCCKRWMPCVTEEKFKNDGRQVKLLDNCCCFHKQGMSVLLTRSMWKPRFVAV